MKKEIGHRVKEARESKGIRQGDLADMLGVQLPTYRTWEQGSARFPIEQLIRVCEEIGLSLEYALTGKRSGNGLSAEEYDLITNWRALDDSDKKMIFRLVANMIREKMERD